MTLEELRNMVHLACEKCVEDDVSPSGIEVIVQMDMVNSQGDEYASYWASDVEFHCDGSCIFLGVCKT